MATDRDEELLELESRGALAASVSGGVDPGRMAQRLAGMHSATIGDSVADRYAQIGSRWLADPVASRLDNDLIDRLSAAGFPRETLQRIRIHRGTKASAAADALGARAFALGDEDLFFGRGEFDPSSREGRAVIAHEVAHVAPPSAGLGGMPAAFDAGGSMGGPVLNERKSGSEDAAEDESHERQARQAEAMVYAQDDNAVSPTLADMPQPANAVGDPDPEPPIEIDEAALNTLVWALLTKMDRGERERSGAL